MKDVKNELVGKMMFHPWYDIHQDDFDVEIDGVIYQTKLEYLKKYAKKIMKLRTNIGGVNLAIVVLISVFMGKENFWVKLIGIIGVDIVVILFTYYFVIKNVVLPKDIKEILRKKKVK